MILIRCYGHELRFSKDKGAQVILVHFMQVCPGASFLWFVENYVESRLVLVHRVEDNLPGKQEQIITVKKFRGSIRRRTKDTHPMPPRVNTLNWCHFAFELTNQNSPGRKILTPWRQCMLQQERYLSRVAFLTVVDIKNSPKRFRIQKTVSDCKKGKIWEIMFACS